MSHRRILLLIIVPVALLIAAEVTLRLTSAKRLSLVSIQLIRRTNSQRLDFTPPDHRVPVVVRYNAPSLYSYFVSGPRFWSKEILDSSCLIDEKGKRYSLRMDGVQNVHYSNFGGGHYEISYPFRLSRIPTSAGRVTFHAKIKVDEGYELPVSLRVRDK